MKSEKLSRNVRTGEYEQYKSKDEEAVVLHTRKRKKCTQFHCCYSNYIYRTMPKMCTHSVAQKSPFFGSIVLRAVSALV